MAELLLEILSEEIPARMQARAADDLKRLVAGALKDAGLAFSVAKAFATPRRLALVVDGIPERQPDVTDERKGPAVGAPDKAIEGFLGSVGLALDQCEKRDVKGKEFWFAVISRKGLATKDVLAEILPDVLAKLPWPKSMRWGAIEARWVRPIHSILVLFAGDVVNFTFAGMAAGNTTAGHRFLAPQAFTVRDAADYKAKLRAAKVILDSEERRERLLEDADRLAEAEGLRLRNDPALFEEVTGLVEWPVALMGRIDDAFMDLPAEVLTESMRAHQKYFALEMRDHKLAPRFVTIANMLTDDGGAAVVAGNERVLRARLSDARFFWDQDRKAKLESRVAKLAGITFHAKLGTVAEKVDRMESLAAELCEFIPGSDRDKARSAAHLAKADLTSGMVGEFPELQGIMGRYYALNDGEDADVAEAIAQHYAPRGPNDSCPTAPTAIAVALADKIDSLVGFFAVGEKPTGSRDPFALRRAALGVIRIITENGLRLPLYEVIRAAITPFRSQIRETFDSVAVRHDLIDFFEDRLKVQMREKGVRHDLIDAVFALGGEDDLVRLLTRVDALTALLGTDDGANLLTAYRRAANIVAIEEKKDKIAYDGAVDEKLLTEPQEKHLNEVLAREEKALAQTLKAEKYGDAMAALAHLRAPVDAFFDHVTVNCDDRALRANRLRLLSRIRAALNRVADFSKIEG
ncbi:MAG: glycine--tRNA ligase subunit beta [Alphaproteobacteria bacterium]|nr:glycine--tRNA ligase subunit beta [Alphaproteobacteria bacterium]